MPRIRIKKLPKAAFGLPVQGMQAIQNAANQDIQRQDQIAGRMADQPFYNPFDVKWGQQQYPQVDITGASSNTQYDPYATSTNSSMTASKGSFNLPQLVNPSLLSPDPKQNIVQPKSRSFGQKLKGIGMGALKGIDKAGDAIGSVIENPYFQLGIAGANILENRQRQKDYKKFERERLFNLDPVGITERGDYDQNGIFQPNNIGFGGVGTQANAYYPQQGFVEYGGELPYAAEGMIIEGDRIVQPAFLPDLPPMPVMVPRDVPVVTETPTPPTSSSKYSKSSGVNPMAKQTWDDYSTEFEGVKNYGIWGDEKHKKTKSDHNTGDALDIGIIDANQGSKIAQKLISEADKRNVKYIIWNKQIWNPSISNEWRPYTGKNPHTSHVHVSFNRSKNENNAEEGQISYTHNNPLNVHYGKFASQYGAEAGADDAGGKVAMFPNLEVGIEANKNLMFGPDYNNLTISQARNKWVTGKTNGFTSSTLAIVQAMGGDKKLSDLNAAEKDKLFKLFAKWEGKQAYNLIKDRRIFNNGGQNNNSMKIRIVETPDENPEMANGGQPPYSGQTDYGLYVGQRNLYKTMAKHPYEDVNNTISEEEETPEDPYVLEAEGGGKNKVGETILHPGPNGGHYFIEGDRHSEDGVKLKKSQAPEGSFIYSDTAKMKLTEEEAKRFGKSGDKKHTPAAVAKQYNKNKYLAILQNKLSDPRSRATAKKMLQNYDDKLAELALIQESKKGFPQGIPDVAKQFFEKMTGQPSGQQQPQEMTARYGGAYKHGGMHGNPGTYPDGYSGTYSNGVYFDYGGALQKFQSKGQVPYTGVNPDDVGGINTTFNKAASRKYTLPSWLELWTKANTAEGAKSPAHGYPSTYDPKVGNQLYDDYEYWRDRYGKDFEGSTDKEKQYNYQKFVFDELQKGNPSAINYITETWGPTINSGKKTITDDPKNPYYGARMAFAAGSRIPVPQTPPGTTGTVPVTTTDGTTPNTTNTTTTTKVNPNEYNPSGKSNIPWDYLQQDINNINAAAMNLALMKKYNMQSRSVQPNLPRFIAQDWRAPAAAAFSTQYAAPMATLSQYSGRQGIGSMASKFAGDAAMNITGNIIPQVAAYNAAGATQTDAQRAQILNQFAQYNSALRDSDTRENIGLDSKYRFGIGKGFDRLTASKNMADTNRATMYAMNLSESPDYFYNPRNQRMTFNSPQAYYNFMNKTRGGYQDESAANDDMFKRAFKYKEAGFSDAVAAQMAGFGRSASAAPRQRNIRYPGTIANRTNTTMPSMDAYTQSQYGYPQPGYDYSSMIGG